MKTIESTYAAGCREHGCSPKMTQNEVRLMLAERFGNLRTKAELEAAIQADLQ